MPRKAVVINEHELASAIAKEADGSLGVAQIAPLLNVTLAELAVYPPAAVLKLVYAHKREKCDAGTAA